MSKNLLTCIALYSVKTHSYEKYNFFRIFSSLSLSLVYHRLRCNFYIGNVHIFFLLVLVSTGCGPSGCDSNCNPYILSAITLSPLTNATSNSAGCNFNSLNWCYPNSSEWAINQSTWLTGSNRNNLHVGEVSSFNEEACRSTLQMPFCQTYWHPGTTQSRPHTGEVFDAGGGVCGALIDVYNDEASTVIGQFFSKCGFCAENKIAGYTGFLLLNPGGKEYAEDYNQTLFIDFDAVNFQSQSVSVGPCQ